MTAESEISPAEQESLRRDWIKFTALSFLFMFGFSVYGGVFQNFLRDNLHAKELDLGILESTREIPGLLTALTATILVSLAESRVAALGLAVCAAGIAISGTTTVFSTLVGITVFWSIGFHLYATMSSPITLALAKGKEGGRHLGRMSAVGAVATIAGLGAARLMSQFVTPGNYEPYFAVAGVSIFGAAVLCAMLSHHAAGGKRQRLVLRREYQLFYLLSFLEGCRRQIFSIFASFALILVYHVPVGNMLTLQLVNALLIAVTAPKIGKLVDKMGERGPLTFYAIGLIVVFLGYAVTRRVEALYALFLLDNILFSFSVGFTTYLHRIVRPGEMTPCVAMGVTMNHIAAVTVPVGGALLWKSSGNYQLPFWVGVAIAAVSLVATRWLPQGPRPAMN